MTEHSSQPQTASEIMQGALMGTDPFTKLVCGSTLDQALGGFASGHASAFARSDAIIEAAKASSMGMGLSENASIKREIELLRESGLLSQAEKALPTSHFLDEHLSRSAEGRMVGFANRSLMDEALGISGTLAKTLDELKGLHGFDSKTIAGLSDSFGDLASASTSLDDLLSKQERNPILDIIDREHVLPSLPLIPENPILRTNELLEDMNRAGFAGGHLV